MQTRPYLEVWGGAAGLTARAERTSFWGEGASLLVWEGPLHVGRGWMSTVTHLECQRHGRLAHSA